MSHINVRFINSGTRVDEGVFSVEHGEPYLYFGRPALKVKSPFGLGGELVAFYMGDPQGVWVCDLD